MSRKQIKIQGKISNLDNMHKRNKMLLINSVKAYYKRKGLRLY